MKHHREMLVRANTEPRIDTQLALVFDTALDSCELSFFFERGTFTFVYRRYRYREFGSSRAIGNRLDAKFVEEEGFIKHFIIPEAARS
jgi:hypothetical protein